MTELKLRPSPRLYIDRDTVENLGKKLHSPFLTEVADEVVREADRLVEADPVSTDPGTGSYQPLMREIDCQLQYLTTAWVLTKDAKYRAAAMRHLANILKFKHISCEAGRDTPADKKMFFCLSYGQIALRTGVMYDLFRPKLTVEEKKVFFDLLDRFLMERAFAALDRPPWWVKKPWSNWNGVCAGGMGVMALAFYDDYPGAKKLIPFVEESLKPYLASFRETGGGCREGTSYWNFGMNYAMRYLLSWENATGMKHPAFEIEEIGKSLQFALDFHGVSFGDGGNWGPTCFFFKVARRMNKPAAAMSAANYLLHPKRVHRPKKAWAIKEKHYVEILYAADCIPTAEAIEADRRERAKKRTPVARVYSPMGWGALADSEAFPRLRMSVRGGSSAVKGHGMLDLLSIKCDINGERMIVDQADGTYMSTTFSPRGVELFGRSPASKSTLLVNGLGCFKDAECKSTEIVKGDGFVGVRVDGTGIYLPRWSKTFIGRLVLLIEGRYWLVIDRVEPLGSPWVESRFLTYAETERKGNSVSFKSGNEQMQLTYASLGKAVILEAVGLPATTKARPATILRCMDEENISDNLHVVALNPGDTALELALRRDDDNVYAIQISKPGGEPRTIRVSSRLTLK